jgi:hypothetical protein
MNPTRKQGNRNQIARMRFHKTLWRRDEQGVTVEKRLIAAAGLTAGGIWINRYSSAKALRGIKTLTKGDG